jgi:predicted DNA-binding protein
MKRSMKISNETFNILAKRLKCRKRILHDNTLDLSIQELVMLIMALEDEFSRTHDYYLKKAIDELIEKKQEYYETI